MPSFSSQIDLARIDGAGLDGTGGDEPWCRDRIGYGTPQTFRGERAMNIRFSRLATGMLVVAAIVLMSGYCWAVFIGLGPSKDSGS